MIDTLIFGSLFTGIGGLDLGLERAGMVCEWQVEIDPFCQKVLAKHWPDVRRFGDVRECGAHNLETVDLICGGFPCQPHSVAGKRKGAEDDRNLWPEFIRIVAELRPRWVVGENVPGLKTTMLDQVLSDLDGAGYATATLNLPAVAFDALHRRERLFIVAYATGRQNLVGHSEALGFTSMGAKVADTNCQPPLWTAKPREKRSPWATEPDVGRVAHGVPDRVDRLRALGNAVVPQVAEWIGKQITASESYKR